MLRDGSRRLIASADPIAQAVGLRPGQPVAQAQASVPGLAIVEATPEADASALVALAAWCIRYAPVVQVDGPNGILIDVEGAAHLFEGGEAGLMADAMRRLARAGIAARAALAPTPAAAWALARHRPGAIVSADALAEALAPLPVSGLRLDPEMVRALALVGVERIGDLAGFPRPALALRFGPDLLHRHDRALGRAPDPLTPLMPETMPQVRMASPEPLGDSDGLAAALLRLVPRLCRELERRRAGLRRLDALFRRVDGRPIAIRVGTALPSRDPAHLMRLLTERLPSVDPGFGIDEVSLVATRIEALHERQVVARGALDPDAATGGAAALAPLVDRLAVRLGPARVFRAAPVESRMPERAVRRVPPLAPLSRLSWPAVLPRPSRMIDPPEQVTAFAIVPDDPPASFVWRRIRYVVRAADGPERVRGEWWRDDAEVASLRDYYRVEDTGGHRFWLFRDAPMAEGGRWWLHGRFA